MTLMSTRPLNEAGLTVTEKGKDGWELFPYQSMDGWCTTGTGFEVTMVDQKMSFLCSRQDAQAICDGMQAEAMQLARTLKDHKQESRRRRCPRCRAPDAFLWSASERVTVEMSFDHKGITTQIQDLLLERLRSIQTHEDARPLILKFRRRQRQTLAVDGFVMRSSNDFARLHDRLAAELGAQGLSRLAEFPSLTDIIWSDSQGYSSDEVGRKLLPKLDKWLCRVSVLAAMSRPAAAALEEFALRALRANMATQTGSSLASVPATGPNGLRLGPSIRAMTKLGQAHQRLALAKLDHHRLGSGEIAAADADVLASIWRSAVELIAASAEFHVFSVRQKHWKRKLNGRKVPREVTLVLQPTSVDALHEDGAQIASWPIEELYAWEARNDVFRLRNRDRDYFDFVCGDAAKARDLTEQLLAFAKVLAKAKKAALEEQRAARKALGKAYYASAAAALAGDGDRDGVEFVVKTRAARGAFWKKAEPEYSSLATLVMDLEGVTVADGEAPVEKFGWREVVSCEALQQDQKDGRHRLLKLNLRDGPMMFETEQAADICECFSAFTQAIADSLRAAGAAGEAQPPQQAGRGTRSPAAAQLSDLFGDAVGEAEARRALEARNGDIQQAFEDLASRLHTG